MKIVLQRVKSASVRVGRNIVGSIGPGVLILLGIHRDDSPEAAAFLASKCTDLRIFSDEQGKMNRSLKETGGGALVVSQFTLLGDCSKGRRPSFIEAAPPDKGKELYEHFLSCMKSQIDNVECGIFGAMMDVELINDGPVTMLLER